MDAGTTHDPGKLGRAAAGLPVVPVFDGYRALAILGIVVMHIFLTAGGLPIVNGGLRATFVWGTFGQLIEVLFMISGFVVFLPTVARGGRFGSIGGYATRRAARLLPAYWMALFLSVLLVKLAPVSFPFALPGPESIGIHLIGMQSVMSLLRQNFAIGFGIDGPVWTLTLEITFYVILPFIAAAYFRRPLAGLLIAAAITAVCKESLNHLGSVTSFFGFEPSGTNFLHIIVSGGLQFPNWAFSFALGMTGAWAFVRFSQWADADLLRRRALWVQIASVISLAAFAYVIGNRGAGIPGPAAPGLARHGVLTSLGFSASLGALMVATALGPLALRRPFANASMRWLGDISYGIYLIHIPVVIVTMDLLHIAPDGSVGSIATLAAVVLPISVVYGYLSARLLEQPIRRWARKFGRRGYAVAADSK